MFDWWAMASVDALIAAASTGVVGIAAVAGAAWVGKRQVDIAHRQTDILASQVALEAAKLKADLFERRLATYEAAAAFLAHLGDRGETSEGKARISLFATKLRESRFLFHPDVYAALEEIWEKANQVRVAQSMCRSDYENGRTSNSNYIKTASEAAGWSLTRLQTLHETFRHDLDIDARGLSITT